MTTDTTAMNEKALAIALRRRLWDLIQPYEGYGFVSDADDHCGSLDELEYYCESQAAHLLAASNVCRAIARSCRKKKASCSTLKSGVG